MGNIIWRGAVADGAGGLASRGLDGLGGCRERGQRIGGDGHVERDGVVIADLEPVGVVEAPLKFEWGAAQAGVEYGELVEQASSRT